MTERQPASPEDYVRKDQAALLGYLLHLGLHLEDAKDVAGETIRRMCENWSNISYPRAWARTTAYRLAIDEARARRSEEGKSWRAGLQQSLCTTAVDDLWMLKEEQRIVIDRIRQLPEKQRAVIALHLDGFSNTEIADIIDAKANTVSSNLRHAKKGLAVILAREGVYRPTTPRGTEGGETDGGI